MNNDTLYPRNFPSFVALLLAWLPFVAVSISLGQDDQTAFDPWFSQTVSGETQDEDGDSTSLPNTKSPASLYRIAMRAYHGIPEGNISKRIAALEEAVSVHPAGSEEARDALAQLKQQKSQAHKALDAANLAGGDLRKAAQALAPHADLFSGDPSLLFQLLESDFSQALDRRIAKLGETGDSRELASLNETLASSGLNQVLGQRFDRLLHSALAQIIESKWTASSNELLPGEAFLMGRLLQEPSKKMTLQLRFPEGADETVRRNVARSFERRWGRDFEIFDEHLGRPADLELAINIQEIATDRQIQEQTVASTISGHVKEEPNPEFMAMAAEYEKAAKRYDTAMKSYEANYEQYIERSRDPEYENAQRDLRLAEENFRNTPPPAGPTPSQEFLNAQAHLESAKALANSISHQAIPEPVKPRPTHLDILQEIYLVPSTIVTSEDPTPYEYTKQTLNYTFSAAADLALRAPADDSLSARAPVQLAQDRLWVRNQGAHPKDPSADGGDYSEEALQSAVSLFSLEFGSTCAKAFDRLLQETTGRLSAGDREVSNLERLTLSLALSAQQQQENILALDEQEIEELAALAESSALSPKAFRAKCLALLASKSALDITISPEHIQEQLR